MTEVRLLVSFEVPETFIGELSVGEEARLETWNSRSPVVYGEIVDIGSRIDPQTRTFVARARVPNETDTLRPGMSFRVVADIDGEIYPVVAETGVQWGADGAYVWSIENGQATRVPVQVVQRREGRVLISGDFREGDVVVVEGIQRMQEGIDVTYEAPRVADRVGAAVAIELLDRVSAGDAGLSRHVRHRPQRLAEYQYPPAHHGAGGQPADRVWRASRHCWRSRFVNYRTSIARLSVCASIIPAPPRRPWMPK